MNDHTLDAIRRMIDRGMDNETILDMLDTFGVMADSTPSAVPIGRRAVIQNGRPAVATDKAGHVSFVKPDVTTKMYRLLAPGRKALAGQRFTGNKLACMAYLASQANGEADTRAMRAAILIHKLSPVTGRNAAIESALHELKTDGYIASKPKPFVAPPMPNTGVPLD